MHQFGAEFNLCYHRKWIAAIALEAKQEQRKNMTTTQKLDLHKLLQLTDEQFYELCQKNRDLRIERTAKGEVKTAILSDAIW